MTDVFISYARVNRDTAQAVAAGLSAAGLDVWWDRDLTGGGDFASEIEQHLGSAPVSLVLWSTASIKSDFVRDESSRARDLNKLLPVRIEAVALPLGFGTLHTLDLLDWDGDPDDDAFVALLAQVRQRVAAGRASAPATTGASRVATMAPTGELDPLARRRARRRLLVGLGALGVLAGSGGGWMAWRAARQREALQHLNQALTYHFNEPHGQSKAQIEYRLATELDPTLAEAHYYWAHLLVADMSREAPPFEVGEREGLRQDATRQFQQAVAHADTLGGSRLAVARAQLALLTQQEPVAVARESSAPVAVAAAETPVAATPEPLPQPTPPEPVPLPASSGRPPHIPIERPRPTPAAVAPAPTASAAAEPLPTRAPAPAAVVVARLPRVPPRPERDAAVRQLAQGLFGDSRDGRLAASSALSLDPALGADALPSVLAQAVSALDSPPDDASRAGATATLALLARSTPSVLRANQAGILRLQAALGAHPGVAPDSVEARLADALRRANGAERPVVYLQVADARQMPLARRLAATLTAAGFQTPDIETTGAAKAPSRPEVRSHGGSDPGLARWCLNQLGAVSGTPAVWAPLRNVRPANDTFEIWFDKALCAAGGREVDGLRTGLNGC